MDKMFRDPLFRSTVLNILKYLIKRENIGTIILNRIKRKAIKTLPKPDESPRGMQGKRDEANDIKIYKHI
jgi:hypothetical protein